MSKIFKVTLASMFAFAFAFTASAATATFTTNMSVGSTGQSVKDLQVFLNSCPDTALAVTAGSNGSAGFESTYFGMATKAAVMKYQTKVGVSSIGIVGPMTRAAMSSTGNACGSSTTTTSNGCPAGAMFNPMTGVACTTTSTTTGVTGGAGSVSSYKLVSSISNEKVGENQSNVQVTGIEVKADASSDLGLSAVRVVFNEGTASSDFERYAKDVTVWLGSTKLATVPATDFTDTNDWTKTISLSGGVIKAGTTGTLYVAVSGISNLDSNDAQDTWTVDVTSLRFVDGQGAVISEDPTTATRTFSFEKYATAANTELKISTTVGQDAINKAHVVEVDATDDTNDVSLFAFTIEVKGTSDITLSKLPVNFDVTGAGNVDDVLAGSLKLYMNGSQIGSASVSSDCIEEEIANGDCASVGTDETYLFEDMTATMSAGQKANFVVKGDLLSIADALDEGDTIAANFGETQTDTANFKAKDQSNTTILDAAMTGTATGEAITLRSTGISVALVGTPTVVKSAGDPGASPAVSDSGMFSITFDVTAYGGDMWIDKTAPDASGGATESDLDVTGTGTLTGTITNVSGATTPETAGTNAFVVREGTTQRFTVTANVLATASGFFDVALTNILYATSDVDGDTVYDSGMSSFKTGQIFLTDY